MIEPVLVAWRFERRGRALAFGRPPEHDLRDIMDAILYVERTGVQWRYLPHDFPHWNTVYGYFAKWADEGSNTRSRRDKLTAEQLAALAELGLDWAA